MSHEALIEMLKGLASGLASLLGSNTEIVLHDLNLRQIVYIENSNITGRSVGYKGDNLMYDSILENEEKSDQLIGYKSSSYGKPLRVSHFIFRDETGYAFALLCINQDISIETELQARLTKMLSFNTIQQEKQLAETDENYIQKMMQRVILNSIEQIKPMSLDSKEGKLEVIRLLEYQGVFAVKDSVPQVCDMLSISQATLYNYLRELRVKKK